MYSISIIFKLIHIYLCFPIPSVLITVVYFREAEEAFKMADIDAARNAVAKLKYYDNIYNKVREYERAHGIVS